MYGTWGSSFILFIFFIAVSSTESVTEALYICCTESCELLVYLTM